MSSSLQTTIPRKLEFLQRLSKEEQAIGAAMALTVVAAAVYASRPAKKVSSDNTIFRLNIRFYHVTHRLPLSYGIEHCSIRFWKHACR
jgi:hypothetical protein